MITFRDRTARGRTQVGWLDSRHSFSFGGYRDPDHMGFRALRVINEDRVVPGAGFPTHGHREMEIVSYVLEGGLSNKDSYAYLQALYAAGARGSYDVANFHVYPGGDPGDCREQIEVHADRRNYAVAGSYLRVAQTRTGFGVRGKRMRGQRGRQAFHF